MKETFLDIPLSTLESQDGEEYWTRWTLSDLHEEIVLILLPEIQAATKQLSFKKFCPKDLPHGKRLGEKI